MTDMAWSSVRPILLLDFVEQIGMNTKLLQSNTDKICEALGYRASSNFIRMEQNVGGYFSHLYARAKKDCRLSGVYLCKANDSTDSIPIVYVCEAENEKEAQQIHQRVWNQNVVPFLLVVSDTVVRIYNGFGFKPDKREPLDSIPWEAVQDKLNALTRESIDSGSVWYSGLWQNGPSDPSNRLDVRLLENLNALGNRLVNSGTDKIEREVAHGLIGKYIYLRYLRDRCFLSDERLEEWGISFEDVFTRNAKIHAFTELNKRLQTELNGSIFPFPKEEEGKRNFKAEHLKFVAGTFSGEESGQPTLFEFYNFAYIPTELLSTIYEQFLHRNDKKGKEQGAYYTPIPLVNFVLNELEEKKPLEPGMRVLDPSCGSGAFLVQVYRNLIRKKLKQTNKPRLTGRELSSLLTKHIFGIDKDRDACRVAQLGLLLTLLDGLEPPSLFGSDKFHLPILDDNIIEADTFDVESPKLQPLRDLKFDWIIGNPPWKELGKDTASRWVNANKVERPISDSIAEAFLWRSLDFADNNTVIGLLMPAMSLFNLRQKRKDQQGLFRKRFFATCDVWAIANFANMHKNLFAGANSPCAAFFFRPERTETSEQSILTYSPLLANQMINRVGKRRVGRGQSESENQKKGSKSGAWNVTINTSEIRYVRVQDAITGDPLVWKTAMWGSHRDFNLLKKLSDRFESFSDFEKSRNIVAHAGPELRSKSEHDKKLREDSQTEKLDHVPELVGKRRILQNELARCGRIFVIPSNAFEVISKDFCYLRKGRVGVPLSICKPPHIFLDKARRMAVYSDDFFIVPARELGIAGGTPTLLKALALYFNSEFFLYHQFFLSSEWGVRADITILDTLKCLPVPFVTMKEEEIECWSNLYEKLQRNARAGKGFSRKLQEALLQEANERINKVLGLRDSERILIHDFVHYKMKFVNCRVSADLIGPCQESEPQKYAQRLEKELNAFFEPDYDLRHQVTVLNPSNDLIAGIRIDILEGKKASRSASPDVCIPDKILELILRQHSQWLYFQRELRVYDKSSIFLFKPNEKIQWIESQALVDADNILCEILASKGGNQ